MCLILFAHRAHAEYPLVLAANRDEYYDRPSAPAGFWSTHPDVLGGRDLSAGGTWLAINQRGKLAAVTNFRDARRVPAARSRGHLVSDFVASGATAQEHLSALRPVQAQFGGFNLLLWDRDGMHYASNRASAQNTVAPGVHGLSNHLLNTPWPKVQSGIAGLRTRLDAPRDRLIENLLRLLSDRCEATDTHLPETGVGIDWERKLSPAFIQSPGYGTRASTVIVLDRDGHLEFVERLYDANGEPTGDRRFRIRDFAPG